jgi:putative phosphoesterase
VLEQLSELAPVRAVRGNNDGPDIGEWGACESLECEVGGISIALIHDAGPAKGRPARMRRRFPAARLVIYGHSHIPMVLEEDGLWLVNPGSPTWKRRQPRPTYAVVTLSTTIDVELVQL